MIGKLYSSLLTLLIVVELIIGFRLYQRGQYLPKVVHYDERSQKFDRDRDVPWSEKHNKIHRIHQFETVVDGGWSEWSPWSECQTTCGPGLKTSNRWCNNPTPENGGKDCVGPQIKKEPCSIKIHCPKNGGWGAWGPWKCSVTCGGGTATRVRLCDNPKPHYGGICIGNATETWTVPCNAFTCLPVRPVSNARGLYEDLKVQMFKVAEGTATSRLHCATKTLLDNLLWELKLDIRKALEWKKNGQTWVEDNSRIDKGKFALDFKRAAVNDTGFYTCELDLLGGGRIILRAFTLIVISSSINLEVEMSQPLELECNSLVLASIYPNTRVSWYFNETLFASFNDTPAALTNTLKFSHAMENMTGLWECKVYELDLSEKRVEKKEKGFLRRVKDKVLEQKDSKDDGSDKKNVNGLAMLNPLFKMVSTPPPLPKIISGQIWTTNVIRLKVNLPKSLMEMLRTPQFMGLCVGVVLLIAIISIALIQGKLSTVMGKAEENAQKFADKKAEVENERLQEQN